MQTLPSHRWDFSATVALLVFSFAARVGLLFWLLLSVILPMAAQFVEVPFPLALLLAPSLALSLSLSISFSHFFVLSFSSFFQIVLLESHSLTPFISL